MMSAMIADGDQVIRRQDRHEGTALKSLAPMCSH